MNKKTTFLIALGGAVLLAVLVYFGLQADSVGSDNAVPPIDDKPPANERIVGTAAPRLQDGQIEAANRQADRSSTQASAERAEPALAGVSSPMARRYLRFMLPGVGRLAGESHNGSIVNGAFAQSWGVTARLNLTTKQQDSLAAFLLAKDWQTWEKMQPDEINAWATASGLTGPERATLAVFVQQCKQGSQMLYELTAAINKFEYGGRSQAEIFALESAILEDLAAPDGGEMAASALASLKLDPSTASLHDKLVQLETAVRPYKLLAERIPLTDAQAAALLNRLRQGAKPPNNPYDFQSGAPERVEPRVRQATSWLAAILNEDQYETYLDHFLAEIEMVRFQAKRR